MIRLSSGSSGYGSEGGEEGRRAQEVEVEPEWLLGWDAPFGNEDDDTIRDYFNPPGRRTFLSASISFSLSLSATLSFSAAVLLTFTPYKFKPDITYTFSIMGYQY